MKKTAISRIAAIWAVLVMLVMMFTLCACDGGEEPPLPPEQSSVEETTEAPLSPTLELIRDGKLTISRIVRSSELSSNYAPEYTATKSLRDKLNAVVETMKGSDLLYDEKIIVEEDFLIPGQSYNSDTVEILVGATAYDESATAFDGVEYGGYAVKVVGNKILVAAYTPDGYAAAADALGALIDKNTNAEDKSVVLQRADIMFSGSVSSRISAIPTYDGGAFYGYYEAGEDVDEIIVKKTNEAEFFDYLKKLETLGYTCYNSNEMAGNSFATYNGAEYTINAGYYKSDDSVRIMIEALVTDPLPNTPQEYTKVTSSQLTLVGIEYADANDATGYVSNGLSMLIRLEDGRFIIVDGGFRRRACAEKLRSLLIEQSKDYVTRNKDITIAAWIITHAHGDHLGTLCSYTSLFAQFKVEKIIVNFMSYNERYKCMSAYPTNWGTTAPDGGSWDGVATAAKVLKTEMHIAHAGEVYCFADARLEVLYTIENIGPEPFDAGLNTTSLIIKANVSGSTLLITGDATGIAMRKTVDNYGSYIQSDLVQVAHHGFTTFGTESGTIAAYKAAAPSCVLWPIGGHAYSKCEVRSYNAPLSDLDANPNYKESFVAGTQGDTVVIPLPYTVGNAIITRASTSNVDGACTIIEVK